MGASQTSLTSVQSTCCACAGLARGLKVVTGMSADATQFLCSLDIEVPFPSERLANAALKTLVVDEELSPLVQRSFEMKAVDGANTLFCTHYKATTNRMLRVAVNGFFESLGVVIQVMEELDVDVIHEKGFEDLAGVQGVVEQGLTGQTMAGA